VVRDGDVDLEFDGPRHVRTRDATTGVVLRELERVGGVLTAIVDRNGNRVEVTRGTDYVRFQPPFGPATRIVDANADGWADRVEYEDAASRTYHITHDATGLLHAIQAPDGRQHEFFYDELGRLIRDEQPGGRVAHLTRAPTSFNFDTRRLTQTVTYTSPGGRRTVHETEFSRGSSPSPRRTVRHPDGTRSVTEVGELSQLQILTTQDEERLGGLVGSYFRETVSTAPDGTESRLYETVGSGATLRDPLPAREDVRTPLGRTLRQDMTRTRQRDTGTGALQRETVQHTTRGGTRSRTLTTEHDLTAPDTSTVTTQWPSGTVVSTVLDTADRPVQIHAPGLAPQVIESDSRGRVLRTRQVSTEGFGTREVTFSYDDPALGQLWSPYAITGAGTRTTMTRDALRRVTSSVTTPASCSTNAECDDGVACNGAETCSAGLCVPGTSTCSMFEWDTSDRLSGVRPLARQLHELGYDDADRGTGYTPPAIAGQPSGDVQVTRDADGLVTRVDYQAESLRSVVTNRLPDGRPDTIVHEGRTLTFGYHPVNAQLQSVQTSDGVNLAVEQDGPLLQSVAWGGSAGVQGTVAFGYDDLWDVSSVTVSSPASAGGLVANYGYDADGTLACVTPAAPVDGTCSQGLRVLRNLPGRTLTHVMAGAAGLTSGYQWSDLGEATTTIHEWLDGATVRELGFAYAERDAAGRLTGVIETLDSGATVDIRYAYDRQGRLREVRRDGVVTEAYAYEANGQRTSAQIDGVSVSPIVFDARDRLTQYGDVTYQYDALGRRTSRTEDGQTTTYTYDLLGALRAVDLPGGSSPDIEYVIDGAGRRVGRKAGGILTQAWLYLDGLRPIAELNGAGELTRVFVYGDERVPALMVIPAGQANAGTYRILTDHLGSVRRVVNVATGHVLQALDYDAFGNILSDTNPGLQPFGFAGGLYDPDTGLLRFGARDYDPEIGQWTARDPILFAGGDSNLYAYVGSDPVQHTDPSGLIFGFLRDTYTAHCARHPGVCAAVHAAAAEGARRADQARTAVQRMAPSAPRVCALADRALGSTQRTLQSIATSRANQVAVNLGGEGEVPRAINFQGPWITDPAWRSSQTSQTLDALRSAGHRFVIASNDRLPIASSSVNVVYTNSVPLDVATFLGPGVQTSEIIRILAQGGMWIHDGAVRYVNW
jgi:RHS repeat-associated protein